LTRTGGRPLHDIARGRPRQETAPETTSPASRVLVPAPTDIAAALAEAEHIGQRAAAELALARWFGRIEYGRGWRAGYTQAAADLERDWQQFAQPVAERLARDLGLMERRWGPGGRARFGDPQPGDRFPVREGAA